MTGLSYQLVVASILGQSDCEASQQDVVCFSSNENVVLTFTLYDIGARISYEDVITADRAAEIFELHEGVGISRSVAVSVRYRRTASKGVDLAQPSVRASRPAPICEPSPAEPGNPGSLSRTEQDVDQAIGEGSERLVVGLAAGSLEVVVGASPGRLRERREVPVPSQSWARGREPDGRA